MRKLDALFEKMFLSTVAQEQTQVGTSAHDALRIIRFWQTIEAFLPAAPPKLDPDNNIRNVSCDEELPWSAELPEYYPQSSDKRWVFLVHVGIFQVEPVVEEICQLMGASDDPERARAGEASLACMVVDGAGAVIGQPSISALPWGMGQLIKTQNSRNFEAKDFSEIETALTESIQIYLQQERIISSGDASNPDTKRPLRVSDFNQIIGIVNEKAGWSPEECILARYKGLYQKRNKNNEFPEVEPDIINSFFINDLGRVSRSIAADGSGEAITKFLFGIREQNRKNLRDARLQRECLHPRLLPAGQWPSPPDQPLALAQQIAVNLAADMSDRSDLIGVNGPPGTGKTTLLRDLIAANIVKRAERLCSLRKPDDAFPRRAEVKGSNFPAWHILDALCGFEMVVASSNNGAVDNVTKELPLMTAIADDWREHAVHFREVADAILAPDDHLDADGICWGLIAAALGKKEHRSKFAQRFWFSKPEDKEASRPVSMQMASPEGDGQFGRRHHPSARDTSGLKDESRAILEPRRPAAPISFHLYRHSSRGDPSPSMIFRASSTLTRKPTSRSISSKARSGSDRKNNSEPL